MMPAPRQPSRVACRVDQDGFLGGKVWSGGWKRGKPGPKEMEHLSSIKSRAPDNVNSHKVTRQIQAQFIHECIFKLYFPSPSHPWNGSFHPMTSNPSPFSRPFSHRPSGLSSPSCILCARILLFEFPFMSQSRHFMPSILGAVLHFMLSDSAFRVPLHLPISCILCSRFFFRVPLLAPISCILCARFFFRVSILHVPWDFHLVHFMHLALMASNLFIHTSPPRASIHPLFLSTMHFMHLRALFGLFLLFIAAAMTLRVGRQCESGSRGLKRYVCIMAVVL
jgi:hypothetical protein